MSAPSLSASSSEPSATGSQYRSLWCTTRDGLRLHARHYPAVRPTTARPVLCLAGLTRNARDFHRLALALSSDPSRPRDCYALDSRGRGLSDADPDWKNYTVPIEMLDALDFLTMIDLDRAGIIGTSRGGLIAMVMGAVQPRRIGAVVLNDIGPVIERDGLIRISGYVGRMPLPKTWDDAATAVLELTARDFPNLGRDGAEAMARQLFNADDKGRLRPGYDAGLARSFALLGGKIPELWPQFEALKHVPVLSIRGGNSDLLSAATVTGMAGRHPRFRAVTVPDEGHAPLLWDTMSIGEIASFFAATDAPSATSLAA